MLGRVCRLFIGVIAVALTGVMPVTAEDRPVADDWRTGVAVAPGAMTWTNDNFANKKQLINEIASSQGKTCKDLYAFIGWGVGHGGLPKIMATTRDGYEKAGYSLEQRQGTILTDTIWIARNDAREAVILWGNVMGSTTYLSCITSGGAAANPDKPLLLGILSALGLGAVLAGWWLIRRVRALGIASQAWPSVQAVVKSSEVRSYKTKGGKQFRARIAYNYDVDGTAYVGDRLRFGNYAGPLATAEADAAKYKVGARVDVHYDPEQPQVAVLEPGASGTSVLGIVLAITGAVFLAVVLLVALIA